MTTIRNGSANSSPKKNAKSLLERSPSEENLLNAYTPASVTMSVHSNANGNNVHSGILTDRIDAEPEGDEENINIRTSSLSITLHDGEQAIKLAGGFGLYQIGFLITLQLLTVIICGNYSLMQYSTQIPHEITCVDANSSSPSITLTRANRAEFCEKFDQHLCVQMEWKSDFATIIEEWQLICERDYIPEMINSVQTGGNILTAMLTGIVADRYGRKRTFLIAFATMIIANSCALFTQTWYFFLATRTLATLCYYTATSTVFIWGMELYDAKHNIINNISGLWSIGYMLSALICYLAHTWRKTVIALNFLSIPLYIIYWRFVESPRWLIQKGRLDDAAAALSKMARINRPHHPIVFQASNLRGIKRDAEEESHIWTQVTKITTNRRLVFNLFIQGMLTLATASVSQGFLFQISVMSGSPYWSFAILGGMRLIMMPLIYTADKYLTSMGRRQIIILPLLFIAVCYSITAVTQLGWQSSHGDAIEFYTMLFAACATSFLWIGLGQYAVELFPTTVRNTACGITYMFDPIAGMISPQFIYLEEHLWRPIQSVYLLLLVLLVTLMAYLFLPETKGQSVPDTIDDSTANMPPDAVVEPEQLAIRGWLGLPVEMDDDEDRLVDEWQDDRAIPDSDNENVIV